MCTLEYLHPSQEPQISSRVGGFRDCQEDSWDSVHSCTHDQDLLKGMLSKISEGKRYIGQSLEEARGKQPLPVKSPECT